MVLGSGLSMSFYLSRDHKLPRGCGRAKYLQQGGGRDLKMSVFYGWKIGGVCLAGNFLLQGAAIYCMNAFMEPLCESNGWSRGALNLSLGLAALLGQVSMPMAAAISNRYSLRGLMVAGAICGGLATCALGYCKDIRIFTIFLITLWIASQFCGGVVANALISNWFSRYRGLAFGLANSGTSLSGMLLPFFSLVLINRLGLAGAYLFLGICACLLVIPILWLVRRAPQMLNLHPDGGETDPPNPASVPASASLAKLFRTPAAWYIGLSFGLCLMVGSGVLSQLKPRFSDLGLAPYTAMLLASIAAGCGTLAKYLWGWLCDKTSPLFASRALMLGSFCSVFLIFAPPGILTLTVYSVCLGICLGGSWVVLPAVTAWYFGSANFLAAYRFISIFILVRCLGFPVMGLSHSLRGNYTLADIMFGVGLLAAFILTMLIPADKAVEAAREN